MSFPSSSSRHGNAGAPPPPPAKRAETSSKLTAREVACLERLGRGFSNGEISQDLNISEPTVALHLSNARRKLGALTREHALVLALRSGLIDP